MSLAMKRIRNLGWLALIFVILLLLYPLSLNVAAAHSDLSKIDKEIVQTQREISTLRAELRTRASMQQLEEWNALLFGYAAPTADQFADGQRALAGLGGAIDMDRKPVLVASNGDAINVKPAGVIGSAFAPLKQSIMGDDEKEDASPSDIAAANISNKPSEGSEKSNAAARQKDKDGIKAELSKKEKLARIDEIMMSDKMRGDIKKGAAREARNR
ncbi:hypothetical protein LPB140_09455 [Sphingorhabdus lutea]|uniref:Uncharacterized protein n=1 Tax=Sphingorhabdus lutea TaxID=1913578 RepID=A0A1L3JCX6_9SPHN|nr:hypothetical protein [Sphingorhabdus lutea]APG62978.1 hypothetical protein LPB140_09455 [Sphingorhabdus lutea]